jgi:lipocalin
MFKKIINVCLTLLFVGSDVVANDYKPVSELDLNLYQGKWYQVYGDNFDKVFEKDGRCIQADYQIIDSNNVSVLNTQLNSKNQVENITGYAYYTDDHTGGELTVQLDGQGEAPYWVIELGPVVDNQYDYSIVSDNFKISLLF